MGLNRCDLEIECHVLDVSISYREMYFVGFHNLSYENEKDKE